MTRRELYQIANSRVDELLERMAKKNACYSPSKDDALGNFRKTAEDEGLPGGSREALWGFVRKQVNHLRRLCNEPLNETPLEEWVENCGDVAVYMLLLEAIVTEELRQKGEADAQGS